MTEHRLSKLLESLKNVRAAILGDVCLDAYWYADMRRSELSRETPHYNRPVYRETYSGGALANVASNLASLGVGRITIFTILGKDWRGEILKGILENQKVDTSKIIFSDNRFTPMFLKPILEGYQTSQEAPRYDFLTDQAPDSDSTEKLARTLREVLEVFDCVLLGDQVPDGIITPELIESLVELAGREQRVFFTADSRYRIEQFRHMVWKPNDIEAAKALGATSISSGETDRREADRREAARNLLKMGARMVFMTLGEEGCVATDSSGAVHVPGFKVPPPLDFVGAGDAFHAAIAASLAAGSTAEEAALMGNLAASVTVAKIGTTGTASSKEILSQYRKHAAEGPD